ncbi:DUF4292 domain-containing protein [Pararhodonellum marinum]|uniref:DUF4292 domain-containing protein n=1 Tax=Pararhodonellum marinum TaxID=2755358 RepID=UPI00188F3AD5|nr:DUF4292 domain-containing protein [Pararhodonellum marinum]
MNKYRLVSVFLIMVIGLSACAKKPILYTSDEVMEEFQPNYFKFQYLNARARIVLEEPNGKTTRGSLNMRAKKDSIIWFSITPGLGIEAARGIITQDHIKIKDRLNGESLDMTFQEFSDQYGVNLSLDLFQNILFANIPNEFSFRDRLVRIGKTFELSQVRDNVNYETVISTTHGKSTSLESASSKLKGRLTAQYPQFGEVDEQPFPNKLLIRVLLEMPEGPKSTTLNVEMNRVESLTEPLTFPYNY